MFLKIRVAPDKLHSLHMQNAVVNALKSYADSLGKNTQRENIVQ